MKNLQRVLKGRHQKLIIGIAVIILGVLVAAILFSRPSLHQYQLGHYSFDNQQADLKMFENDIRTYGDKKAYNRLADEAASLSADDQHEYGHLFGDALYKVEGLKGIAVCDTRFSYGCFHQILSDALLQYGPTAVPMLDQRCKDVLKDAFLSCEHGLGHGVLVAAGLNKNGYDEAHLKQALSECESLPNDHPLGGCDGGVYMEYNLRTVANVELEQNSIRPLADNDYYAPCDHLTDAQQPTCYFWMSQWWAAAGAIRYAYHQNLSDDNLYQITGSLCDKVPANSTRDCFEGVGYVVISTAGMDPKKSLNLCDSATKDKYNNLYCRSFAASMIDSVTSNRSAALAMCKGLNGNAKAFCDAYAREQGNFFTSLPAPVL